MAGPIWRCSGWHWARAALAWTAFVLLIVSQADGNGQTRARILGADAMHATRAQLTDLAHVAQEIRTGSLQEPAVRHTMRLLDVNSLAAEAFGDNDVRPTIR